MTFSYDDFPSVSRLPVPELRRLLAEGDPMERAWAAWSLALRLGREADPDLVGAAMEAPTPGVRSLLLVVLAGHGERELLETFARDDPDGDVRASACRYLAATVVVEDAQTGALLAERLADDPSASVRAEVLRLARDAGLALPFELVARGAADRDLAVRGRAIDVLLRWPPLDAVAGVLVSRAIRELDDELRGELARAVLDRGLGRRLVATLAAETDASHDRVAEVLRLLQARDEHFAWPELQPFAGRGARIGELVARLLEPSVVEPSPISWLLMTATVDTSRERSPVDRASSERLSAISGASWAAREKLAEILPKADPGALAPSDRLLIRRLEELVALEIDTAVEDERLEEGIDLASLEDSEQPQWLRRETAFLATLRRFAKRPWDARE